MSSLIYRKCGEVLYSYRNKEDNRPDWENKVMTCDSCGFEDSIKSFTLFYKPSKHSPDKFDAWCDRVTFYQAQKAKMRLGQCYMNALADVDKNKYNEYTCTEWDCFYEDKKCEAFINKLLKDWGL